jgi:tripartite-type tricarboxylate transporter receptor subunit TctC
MDCDSPLLSTTTIHQGDKAMRFLTFTALRNLGHRIDFFSKIQCVQQVALTFRRTLLLSLTFLITSNVLAQSYPEKGHLIKIVVPSGAGSAIDNLARSYSKAMEDIAGVHSIVENKPGAEGILGLSSFLASPADGYTMLFASSSMMALNPIMLPKVTTYDPLKDLTPLVTTSSAGLVINLGVSTPFKTMREFIEAARANPGKYSCATTSTTLRMACEYLQASAGIKLLLVPYKTTGAAVMALAAGEVDVIIPDAGSIIGQWKSGRIRPVGVATEERLPSLPQVPTMREQGLPSYLMTVWYATYFKAGTAPEKASIMQHILRKASETPAVKTALKSFVHEPFNLVGDEITNLNRREIEHWSKIVREQGLRFEN